VAIFKIHKVVSSLPVTLAADAIYAVRAGTGFDLYITDTLGNTAHQINSAAGASVRSAVVDFGTLGLSEISVDVAAVGASVGQKVVASASLEMPAGVAEDELEADMLVAAGRVKAANVVRLTVSSIRGPISGQRTINFYVG
jgi:hypothetical protein